MSTIFAGIVRRRMREESVTIRALASTMNLTMKRVREVRNNGTPPVWANASEHCWKQDWLDGIRRAKVQP